MTTPRTTGRSQPDAVSAVVVSYSDPEATCAAVVSLLGGSLAPCEVLVVDNHPAAPLVSFSDDRVRVIHSGENLGYTRACNLAATHARGDWLFFLNPDARADTECLSVLLGAATPDIAVIGAQVLLPDGRTNAGENPLHLTGISWAGGYGDAPDTGPTREVAAVSGAALLARSEAFREVGGLCERYFLYQDDVDLCWRVRLWGWTVRFCPQALVYHDYEFDKGNAKWFYLERNRLWCVLSNYSPPALWLMSPLLLGAEFAILALAVRGGWLRRLLRAWGSTATSLRELRRWRAAVQAGRRVPDWALMSLMTARFQTGLLDAPLVTSLNPFLASYAGLVRRVLRRLGR